jgi:hypothetical protein
MNSRSISAFTAANLSMGQAMNMAKRLSLVEKLKIALRCPCDHALCVTGFDQHRYLHAAAAEALEHEPLSTVQIVGNPEVETGFGERSQTFQKPTSGPG